MSFYSLAFELNGLPSMTNVASGGSRNWRSAWKKTKLWKRFVCESVMGKKPASPLQKALLVLTRFSAIEPDYDGLVSGFKPIIDGLREAGVLANDKTQNIGVPEYRWEKAPAKRGKIRVEVTEVSS